MASYEKHAFRPTGLMSVIKLAQEVGVRGVSEGRAIRNIFGKDAIISEAANPLGGLTLEIKKGATAHSLMFDHAGSPVSLSVTRQKEAKNGNSTETLTIDKEKVFYVEEVPIHGGFVGATSFNKWEITYDHESHEAKLRGNFTDKSGQRKEIYENQPVAHGEEYKFLKSHGFDPRYLSLVKVLNSESDSDPKILRKPAFGLVISALLQSMVYANYRDGFIQIPDIFEGLLMGFAGFNALKSFAEIGSITEGSNGVLKEEIKLAFKSKSMVNLINSVLFAINSGFRVMGNINKRIKN